MSQPYRNRILAGDALKRLRQLPDDLVDAVITSPPYFSQRDYDVDGQLGHESSIDAYIDYLHQVLGEAARVLKPSGSVWLNIDDTYSRGPRHGAPAKSLLFGPERLCLRLMSEGWRVRNRIIWHKPNPMPQSVKDRLSHTHEQLLLLTPNRHYYFDLDAIREPHTSRPHPQRIQADRSKRRTVRMGRSHHPNGKNPGDVWTIPTSSYRGAHFATYPAELIRRPILATVPTHVCTACGQPWQRKLGHLAIAGATTNPRQHLKPACGYQADHQPGLVLDPFLGSGTTAIVAQDHQRDWLGIELNPDYITLAHKRLHQASTARQPPQAA